MRHRGACLRAGVGAGWGAMALKSVFYSDHRELPLPEGHRFPIAKYRLLRELLLSEGTLTPAQLHPSRLATEDELRLAHTPEYVAQIRDGHVPREIIQRIGFPWSPGMFTRASASVGGTLDAAECALRDGIAGSLSGGTHHAHADRGEGYCVFNDIAVATRKLMRFHGVRRVAIVDLDVHQGNGNSSILGRDEGVFILSLHGEKNYPFKKVPSTLDIALPDHADDEQYLRALDEGLAAVRAFGPDFVFYQMGVDALKEDRLGKLDLTFEGLIERDRRVFEATRALGVPVSLALGGGYAVPVELTVRAYANTYVVANEMEARFATEERPGNFGTTTP